MRPLRKNLNSPQESRSSSSSSHHSRQRHAAAAKEEATKKSVTKSEVTSLSLSFSLLITQNQFSLLVLTPRRSARSAPSSLQRQKSPVPIAPYVVVARSRKGWRQIIVQQQVVVAQGPQGHEQRAETSKAIASGRNAGHGQRRRRRWTREEQPPAQSSSIGSRERREKVVVQVNIKLFALLKM